jgi:sec-independent protein translocase protein TatB
MSDSGEMFGFSIWHMTVIAVIALVFIGPKEMPKVMRVLARAVGQIRRLSAEFHGHFNELIREAEQAEERTVAQSKGGTQQVE